MHYIVLLRSCAQAISAGTNLQYKFKLQNYNNHQGPVVQSIISLTSSLVVKMLIVLVSTI